MRHVFGCAAATQPLTFDAGCCSTDGCCMLPGNSQPICTGDYQFVHCHAYLRCLVYESMYSLYRTSSTMTECDYKKPAILAEPHELRCYDQWRRLAGFPCHVTETANKLRVAIAFGRVTVYVRLPRNGICSVAT